MRTFSIVLADDEPQILHGMLGGIPWEQLGFSVAATAGQRTGSAGICAKAASGFAYQ